MTYRLLDLFSGIGGFSLGLERSGGFKTVAFCEIDPYCRKVLAKHWPEVPQYDDIRSLTAERLAADGIAVDAICGGFPCTDISLAGKGAGLYGPQSSLWFEYARLIGELRPRYVFVENVAALLGRGLDRVLGDLAALGFDAEWHCIPASAVGAPHRRDRLWIMANASSERCGETRQLRREQSAQWTSGSGALVPDAYGCDAQGFITRRDDAKDWQKPIVGQIGLRDGARRNLEWETEPDVGRVAHGVAPKLDGDLIDAARLGNTEGSSESRFAEWQDLRAMWLDASPSAPSSELRGADAGQHSLPSVPCASGQGSGFQADEATESLQGLRRDIHSDAQQEAQHLQSRVPIGDWPHQRDEALGIWGAEPDVGRVASGVPKRVDRLRALGNAVVPQIPELLGRAVMAAEGLL